MQLLRRPQQFVLSGFGVAGAVLAAVVVTFTLASGIVAYNLTSADPIVTSSHALVLDPLRATGQSAAPLVLRGARGVRSRARDTTRAGVARTASAGATARGQIKGSLSPHGSDRSGGRDGVSAQDPVASQPPSTGVRRPVGKALEDTTQAVGATTDSLSRRLQSVTGTLGSHTQQIGQESGTALREVVGAGTGAVVRLLSPRSSG